MSASVSASGSGSGLVKNEAVARSLGRRRHRINMVIKALCVGATILGLLLLSSILFTLMWRGLGGLGLSVFTETTETNS